MLKRIALNGLFAIVMLVSCSDSTTVYEQIEQDISLETNSAVLANSLTYDVSGVIDIYEEIPATNKLGVFPEEEAGDYPLTLVAQVEPPVFRGADNLTASHIDLVGDYAYISYNTANEIYAGGMDIINVANPDTPVLTSRLYYRNADISSVKYDQGYLYAVGGVDAEKSATASSNAFVVKIPVINGEFNLDGGLTYGFQEGFVATDIEVNTNGVFVTSGKDGYITQYDKTTLTIINEAPFADLRSLVATNDQILVLDASLGVRKLNNDLIEIGQIPISSDFRLADKRTLDFNGENIIVAEGAKGAGVYDASTGALKEYVPILINPAYVAEEDIVTNATAYNDKVMLMANGGAGLCLSEDNNGVNMVGIIELSGSINYVATKGDYIFAASGREGLQIIKMNRPSSDLQTRCAESPEYAGSSKLLVQKDDVLSYSGSKRFRSIDVKGSLLLCGSWTVINGVDVDDDATFEMQGTMVIGRNNRRRDIKVEKNATMRIEGSLTIYGDLELNDNATLEFLGPDARINVYGEVKIKDTANVIGEFEDVQNKF
ncbi:MAG: hypothetical protein HKP24_07325 [Croceitalea sp.]|nr:hypothetical protein [Croceitalea sp.]